MAALTPVVKELALEAGFARVGIASAAGVPAACAERFRRWLDRGDHAGMSYLAARVPRRLAPARLVPGARSVICLAAGYAPGDDPPAAGGLVARYARGRDYHKVLKKRCRRLMDRIRQRAPSFVGRAFVDAAPVMERTLAAAAGVGFVGRNGCLIVPGLGSYVVLCEIVCNLRLPADSPLPPGCHDCGRCVEACPTGAFVSERPGAQPGGVVDAARCISYLTVEHRGRIDPHLWPLMGERLFGCDACQEACPCNEGVPPGDPELRANGPVLGGAGLAEILAWGPEQWDAATRGSTARRAKHEMFLRNAILAAGNAGRTALVPPLEDLRGRHPEFAGMVRWAVARLGRR